MKVRVISVDSAYGDMFDLLIPENLQRLKTLCSKERVHGGHNGLPCSTWSIVRWVPGGPPPLRSRTYPWGLPRLSLKDKKLVADHNALYDGSVEILGIIEDTGGCGSLEHPADRLRHPYHRCSPQRSYRASRRSGAGDDGSFLNACLERQPRN